MGQNLDGEASREILGRRQGFYRLGVEGSRTAEEIRHELTFDQVSVASLPF